MEFPGAQDLHGSAVCPRELSTSTDTRGGLLRIEAGQFGDLPARTYAFGFTRTYAQTLGMDGQKTVDELRQELANFQEERPRYTPGFEPGDPAKVPPRAIVWISAFAAVLFLIGFNRL